MTPPTADQPDQAQRARRFHELHGGDRPLRLVNAWDALSARTFALAGAPAVATSSFAVAMSHGYQDGQRIPWSTVVGTISEIAGAVEVPVSADIEAGQGSDPATVGQSVADVLAAGAVGINLEDAVPGSPGELFDVAAQCERIAAARGAAEQAGIPLFINARTDVWFGAAVPADEQLTVALDRAGRYVEAGADGVFVPGLVDVGLLSQLTSTLTVPVNVMLWPGLPSLAELSAAGVRRLSQGAGAFLVAAGQLEASARAYLEGEPDRFGGEAEPAYHLLGDLGYR